MPVTIVSTTTKPEGTTWFIHTSNQEIIRQEMFEHKLWVESFPGFVSRTPEETQSEHVKKQTLVFETEEAYNNFIEARNNQPFWQNRKAYNEQFGIVTVTEVTVS